MKDESRVLSEIERIRSSAGVDRDGIYGITKKVKGGQIKSCSQLISELRNIERISSRYKEYELQGIFESIC
ncbi:MAG: hypothetical protein WC906_03660 [Parcubacteria group bacterium]|jgi:hypothetical protein